MGKQKPGWRKHKSAWALGVNILLARRCESLADLARRAGMTLGGVSLVLARTIPSRRGLQHLADGLELPFEAFCTAVYEEWMIACNYDIPSPSYMDPAGEIVELQENLG